MIKVKYPVSGAALGSDVEGVGPNVVLKQMYYRDNTTGWTSAELEISLPAFLSVFFFSHPLLCPVLTHFKGAHLFDFMFHIKLDILSHMQLSVISSFCFLANERRGNFSLFFSPNPSTSHNVVFVSFWQFRQTSAL